MRIIALGDTHGRDKWKTITKNNDFDKVLFIGDYFDTKEDVPPYKQKDNFKEIVDFKKANMDKVILLFGNHDYHYLRTTNEHYSGFQPWQKTDIQEMLHKAIDADLLQMCYTHKDILFTHAGVTKTWCRANDVDVSNIEQSINDLFKYRPNAFRFTVGENGSPYGDDVTQPPIWVRSRSLYADKIDGYIQVVGHTVQDKISGLNGSLNLYVPSLGRMVETSGVIFIDTLGSSGEYLQIVDDKMSAVK